MHSHFLLICSYWFLLSHCGQTDRLMLFSNRSPKAAVMTGGVLTLGIHVSDKTVICVPGLVRGLAFAG